MHPWYGPKVGSTYQSSTAPKLRTRQKDRPMRQNPIGNASAHFSVVGFQEAEGPSCVEIRRSEAESRSCMPRSF